jgi:hypothetical protein
LWHVDPLLGNNHEISIYAMVVTKQQPINSYRNDVFCAVCAEMLLAVQVSGVSRVELVGELLR